MFGFIDGPGLRKAAPWHFSSGPPTGASGCVFESRIVQECADSTIDPLLLSLADYASFVEAVSLYGHQSGRRPVIDRKDCFHVQCALHGCITTSCTPSFLGARVMSLQARGQSPDGSSPPGSSPTAWGFGSDRASLVAVSNFAAARRPGLLQGATWSRLGGLPLEPLKETWKQIIFSCRTVQMYRIGTGNKPSGRRSLVDESTGSRGRTGRYKHYAYKE
jgi:hypothetical protein